MVFDKVNIYVQSGIARYVSVSEVAKGNIDRFKRMLDNGLIKEEVIIKTVTIKNGCMNCYFHIDNDYWNTLLDRSGHRYKDWIKIH